MTDDRTRRTTPRKPRAAKPEAESPRARAILDERARRLSRTAAAETPASDTIQLLVCQVGDNLFGLPPREVSRFRSMVPLGGGTAGLLGLMAEGGRVRQVLDFASLVGAPAASGGGYVAVLANHPDIALRLAERPVVIEAQPRSDSRAIAVSAGEHQGKTLVLLSVAELLAGATPMGA